MQEHVIQCGLHESQYVVSSRNEEWKQIKTKLSVNIVTEDVADYRL